MIQHVEEFAAAFIKQTGMDPQKVKMVSKMTDYGYEIYFEPFPTGTVIESYRQRAEFAEYQIARLQESLQGVLGTIRAYMMDLRPEAAAAAAESMLNLIIEGMDKKGEE